MRPTADARLMKLTEDCGRQDLYTVEKHGVLAFALPTRPVPPEVGPGRRLRRDVVPVSDWWILALRT